jgi:lipopolysaccharide export system protein LptA
MRRPLPSLLLGSLLGPLLGPLLGLIALGTAHAQSLGLDQNTTQGAPPQPIHITATNGLDWNQKARTITANGDAKAVRGNVTITANQLVAHYAANSPISPASPASPAAPTPTPPSPTASSDPLAGLDQGQSKLTALEAIGQVHIFTATDQAFGDHAIYHMASGELVLTGKGLRLITPSDTITASKALQYWSQDHRAVALGDAQVVTKDHRSIQADQLTGYFTAGSGAPVASATAPGANAAAGKLRKVIAEGHVIVRTATDIATGDHGVYHPATGIAVLTGNVHITRGPNELAGGKARVNMKTGIATLLAAPGQQVQGVVLPNSAPPAALAAKTGSKTGGNPAVKSPQTQAKPAP